MLFLLSINLTFTGSGKLDNVQRKCCSDVVMDFFHLDMPCNYDCLSVILFIAHSCYSVFVCLMITAQIC
jgi:hypothetical protein